MAMAGRPRKDTIDTSRLIMNLAKSGMTNTGIAEATGLSLRTVQYWLAETDLGETVHEIRKSAKLLESEEKARLNRIALLAAKRLLKYRKTKETRTRMDENGKVVSTETIERECAPDPGTVRFVLKNTDPQNWSDTPTPQQPETAEDTEIKIEIVDGGNDDKI